MTAKAPLKAPHNSKWTPAVQEQIVEMMRDGCYLTVAARAMGIGKRTVYEWREKGRKGIEPYASFELAVGQAESCAEAESIKRVRAGDKGWQGNAWYLERRYPDRWALDRKRKIIELEQLTQQSSGTAQKVEVVVQVAAENADEASAVALGTDSKTGRDFSGN